LSSKLCGGLECNDKWVACFCFMSDELGSRNTGNLVVYLKYYNLT
jgi:hypothetical protein